MLGTSTPTHCLVRIVDDIQGRTTVIETPRSLVDVWFDLSRLIYRVNDVEDDILRASLSMSIASRTIVMHWHSPCIYAANAAVDLLEICKPFHEVEKLILEGGPEA